MSFRSFAITLGVLVFSLTFAIDSWKQGLWHHRQFPAPIPAVRSAAAGPSLWPKLRQASTSPAPPATILQRTTRQVLLPDISTPEAEAQPQAEAAKSTVDPATSAVPVTYVTYRMLGQPDSSTPTLLNVSPNALELNVIATNAPTGVQTFAAVTIQPWGRADLRGLGLSLQPGDRITVQSPPYQDQSFSYQ